MIRINHRLAWLGPLLLLTAGPAYAHPFHGAVGGFAGGLLHPLLGIDHLLAMVAVGVWAAQLGGSAVWKVPLAFIGTLLLGAFGHRHHTARAIADLARRFTCRHLRAVPRPCAHGGTAARRLGIHLRRRLHADHCFPARCRYRHGLSVATAYAECRTACRRHWPRWRGCVVAGRGLILFSNHHSKPNKREPGRAQ